VAAVVADEVVVAPVEACVALVVEVAWLAEAVVVADEAVVAPVEVAWLVLVLVEACVAPVLALDEPVVDEDVPLTPALYISTTSFAV